MVSIEPDIDERIVNVLNGVATPSEKSFLDDWIQASAENERYYREKIRKFRRIKMAVNRFEAEVVKREVGERLSRVMEEKKRQRWQRNRWRIGIVAAAVAVVAVGIGLWGGWETEQPVLQAQAECPVIAPGKSRAIITLADGKQLNLGDSDRDIREQNGTVLKIDSAIVTYQGTNTETREPVFNTLTVPAGGEYHLILADRTKVWVNADSKLKYPVAFQGGRREVFLEGEAYFEVEKDREHPFVVHTSRGAVKVLGTGFNVRAYQNEAKVVTTLVEGQVAYRRANQAREVLLSPGYQLEDNGVKELVPRQVEVEMYVGWKDGKYIFEEATLEEIMDVLSRWYDVAVFFRREELKHLHFTGDLERYENINDFLHFMELGGKVVFHIQGKTIIIE